MFAVIRRLEERVEELERQINRDSRNSSNSPSSDPPKSRAERRRLAREAYKRSMRKSGGQPGHEGKTRQMAPAEPRVDGQFEHLPERCGRGHLFGGTEQRLGDPVVHQQYELPPIRPLIFEHARVRLECPACGRAVLACLPGPALSGYGPRLEAHIAMLAGVFRLSREQVRQVVVEVFGTPASKGAIDATIMRVGRLLHDPWSELRDAVRQAETVHLDETTWRLAGATQWLW